MDPAFLQRALIKTKEASSNLSGSSVEGRPAWSGGRLQTLLSRVVGWR